jgi:hypothetical protein
LDGDPLVQVAERHVDAFAQSGFQAESAVVDQLADRDGGAQLAAGGELETGVQGVGNGFRRQCVPAGQVKDHLIGAGQGDDAGEVVGQLCHEASLNLGQVHQVEPTRGGSPRR